ncbi:MAG: hypothetical protein ACOX8D_04840 [Methanoculleus sp.]
MVVGEHYTRKTCCGCGVMHGMSPRSRVLGCEWGAAVDREHHSAIAIMARFLSQCVLWMGYQQFVGNLRKTGPGFPEAPVHSWSSAP